jgi:hypothetical protein
MKAEMTANRTARLSLDEDEWLTLNNALNEICHGFKVANFDAAIGANVEAATRILNALHESRSIEVGISEASILRNALIAMMAEIEEWEYHTRIGSELAIGNALRNDLDRLTGQLRFGELDRTA